MFFKEADVMKSILYPQCPASLVKKAYEFESNIWIEANGERIDVKNLWDILRHNDFRGRHITIITDGTDEIEAANAIADFVANDYYDDIW